MYFKNKYSTRLLGLPWAYHISGQNMKILIFHRVRACHIVSICLGLRGHSLSSSLLDRRQFLVQQVETIVTSHRKVQTTQLIRILFTKVRTFLSQKASSFIFDHSLSRLFWAVKVDRLVLESQRGGIWNNDSSFHQAY